MSEQDEAIKELLEVIRRLSNVVKTELEIKEVNHERGSSEGREGD